MCWRGCILCPCLRLAPFSLLKRCLVVIYDAAISVYLTLSRHESAVMSDAGRERRLGLWETSYHHQQQQVCPANNRCHLMHGSGLPHTLTHTHTHTRRLLTLMQLVVNLAIIKLYKKPEKKTETLAHGKELGPLGMYCYHQQQQQVCPANRHHTNMLLTMPCTIYIKSISHA